MKIFLKILKYQLKDSVRSRWFIFYGIFFILITELLFRFGGDESKTFVGLMNVAVILIPLVSIVYGVIYVYSIRDYIELLLAQPIKRSGLYSGIYFGLTIPMSAAYLIGISIPYLIRGLASWNIFLTLTASGVLLSFIFTGFAILFSIIFDEKSAGIGLSFLFWLSFSVIYDALIMLILWRFGDYPMENIMIFFSLLNPIDLGRILIMLQFDAAALMGYTGAVFQKFFGGGFGIAISISAMTAWIVIPFLVGMRIFKNKGF